MNASKNIYHQPLQPCALAHDPVTGYRRNNLCDTDPTDPGKHLVCAVMDKPFMQYTKKRGNDLSSVVRPNQRWCLCEDRWNEAYKDGVAPLVVPESTNEHIKDTTATRIIHRLIEHVRRPSTKSNRYWRTLKNRIIDLSRKYPGHKARLQRLFNQSVRRSSTITITHKPIVQKITT